MKRRTDERGQAMVEFTLIATVLATLLLAVFQFGVALSNYISVADAARAAARKAVTDNLPSGAGEGRRDRVVRGLERAHVRRGQLVHDVRLRQWLGAGHAARPQPSPRPTPSRSSD